MSERCYESVLDEHKGLLVRLAAKFAASGSITFEEAMQEARLGLLAAMRGYRPEQGIKTKFSTYAYAVINRALLNASVIRQEVIYVPRQANMGRWHELKVPTVSLDEAVFEGGADRHEFLAADDEARAYDDDEIALVMSAMDELSPTDAWIIRERYLKERTLNEIGADLGVTREAIRQRELRALRKLRWMLKQKERRQGA